MDRPEKPRLRLIQTPETPHRIRFEETFLHHLDALYRTAQRLSRGTADAEDLLQDTLLRAQKGFHQLRDHSKTRAWLFRILVNTFYNGKKKEKREPPIVDVELSEDLVASSQATPAYDPLERFHALFDDEISTALDQLHSDFKVTILLCDVEGLSYEEIAEVCQCSTGTVASRLYRAREILRGTLENYARKQGYLSV